MSDATRLQKALARQGIASRRQIEDWIREGRILVNDKPAELGMRVTAKDVVVVDGKRVRIQVEAAATRVILYHKPLGEICTHNDPNGRPTVFDQMPECHGGKWINIGRLDVNTSGLLLLTNDGELANQLMHPSHEVEREYAVRVLGEVTEEMLGNLLKGVQLEDGMAKFDNLYFSGGAGANSWYYVTLHEGRNREVRRLWEAVGVTVSRLLRVRYGPITLPRALKAGQYQELTAKQISQLRSIK